jgi:hypothetical protein
MSTHEFYREKSQDCLREAGASQDLDAEQTWLQMAKAWSNLADLTERDSHQSATDTD